MPSFTPMIYHFFGVRVHALTKDNLLDAIETIVESPSRNCTVGNHNLHSLYLYHRDKEMRRFYQTNLYTHIDGMSLILMARLLGCDLERRHRTGYLDWFHEFLLLAEKQAWRIYFVGGTPLVSGSLPEYLYVKYPRLNIRTHHGYDGFSAASTVFREIEEFTPHIVIVGMGMPLQEKWITYASERIETKLFLPAGAIMDYVVGVQKPAPRWLGQLGLEWLYRLIHRPRSLFRRYFQEPLLLLPLIVTTLLKGESHVHQSWQPCPLGECGDRSQQ